VQSERRLIHAAFAVREFSDALLKIGFRLFTLASIEPSLMAS
jgi:hypothetical protein